ncbi:MAG: CO dehydrogenase/acetyl-CoA synthase gamma subunit [Candidatus Alkanophagales archaeon MCA70_species_2]|nr:CO dehydrogenase/acetyl-CoA synthase gamma subunit [Candidatus Alkanophaga liquidiphilum]
MTCEVLKMKAKSPMELYGLLPRTNCGECGEKTCMAFASLLIERGKKLEECKPLLEDEKYRESYEKLKDMLAPEVREVVVGVGEHAKNLGGEDVLHRHDLTFFNKTALFYDVWDTMDDDALKERVERIQSWKKFYVGEFLRLDGVAVRNVSGDPKKFAECVRKVSELTSLPLVLCSYDAAALEEALKVVADKRPLVYAATQDNWKKVLELVLEYKVPVVVSAPNDLDGLKSLAATFSQAGVEDIVLDPGTYPTGKGLETTLANFVRLRRAAIAEGQKDIAYPLLCVPMTAWLVCENEVDAAYWETMLVTIFTIKYADIMILHSIEPYALIPQTTLVANIYTDPRRPVAVEPGLKVLGSPVEESPVFVTTNFALTYYTVESDITSSNIDSYLLVIDTEGICVEAAVAGGQLTAAKIKEALEASELENKVKHKTLVLPGLAARISGETEDATGWKVMVGPLDSGRIPNWMEKNWPPK